jgi:hypothetical protein
MNWKAVGLAAILGMLLMAATFCSGGGGSDDDDNDTGDDDSGGNAFDECVSFYMECAGMNQTAAEAACQWIDEYAGGNDCVQTALGNYFDCLDEDVDCDDFDANAALQCASDFSTEVADCGGDDDDNDTADDDDTDDDTADDDDDTGGGDAFDQCVDFYTTCGGLDQGTAEGACAWIEPYGNGDACVQTALGNYFDCLDANVDCSDWSGSQDEIIACATDFAAEIAGCK